MKLSKKIIVIFESFIAILLVLSFVYLFLAVLNKYNLYFGLKEYIFLLVPLFGSAATVVLAILTLYMVREMKQTREDERRPYVFADFVFDSIVILIRVKNGGLNGAKDIKFIFNPSLINSEKINVSNMVMFKEGIKFFPPDKEITTWFDMGPAFYSSGLPKSYTVTISYKDIITNIAYKETFLLDLNTFRDVGGISKKTLHDAVEELSKINRTLQGSNGLLVETAEARDSRHRKYREYQQKMIDEKTETNKPTE